MIWFVLRLLLFRARRLLSMTVMAVFAGGLATSQAIAAADAQSVEPTAAPGAEGESSGQPQDNAAANDAGQPLEEGATTLSAEQITGRPDREIELEREAEVVRGTNTLNADRITYDIIRDEVEAVGNIRIQRDGDRFTGDKARLKFDTGTGYVTQPTYHLQLNNAQGKAEQVIFEGEDRARISQGTYSTCEGTDPDWYLSSSTISLDKGRDIGTASKALLYFKGVPILGTPYMSFPMSDARKSGILPPTFGTTSKGGFELTAPYYFNIAPNRDLTLYPKLISKRGLQLGAQARYLGERYAGETRLEVLPDDQVSKRDRYALSSTHRQSFGQGWSFASNLNLASDDNYPNDFSTTLTEADNRLLEREVQLSYVQSFWSTSLLASSYQVLQDPRDRISRPYDRLPQWTFRAAQQNVSGFDWSVISEVTGFSDPDRLPGASSTLNPGSGRRVVVNPRLSYPILYPGYFVVPQVSVHASAYDVDANGSASNSISRVLPTVSVDSGLIFERDTHFLGTKATQTLEPRLFYVYTPYKNQSDFPLFDTALSDFNFSQIFQENRYSGHDRISDANQLTAAVVSRYIEESGIERMRFALAQRYYLNQQKVISEQTSIDRSEDTKSDILAAVSGRINSKLSLDSSLQYSQTDKELSRANFGVRWQPGPKRVLNLEYRRDLATNPELKLIDISAQWPLARRWYGVGRVNYSLEEKEVAESLIGLEYKADCWVFRMVGQRTPTATGVASTALFFQLELTGFSRIGSDPLPELRENVPGYQLVNQL